MRLAVRSVTALLLLCVPAAPRAHPQVPVFRTSGDAVTVDVSVRRGNRPVTDLTVADFVLTDNGVEQQIAALSYEAQPIDVTVVLDISGSVSGETGEMLRRSVGDLRRDLRPVDRLRVVVFNMQVRRLLDLDAPPGALDAVLPTLVATGNSALYDALAVTLAAPSPPDRRPFIALFSDGLDNASITSAADLLEVARRTRPTVSVLLATPIRERPSGVYADLAAETGGIVTAIMPSDRLGDGFRRILEQFRSSYVLTFVPRGVPRTGRHALEVRVKRSGLDVRARREYVLP
jgi:Ca-activated chloride channel family protein